MLNYRFLFPWQNSCIEIIDFVRFFGTLNLTITAKLEKKDRKELNIKLEDHHKLNIKGKQRVFRSVK